jgi:outer membrane receptor protein involved in Fe transport
MTTVMRRGARVFAALFLVFSIATAGLAQEPPKVTIKVTDPSGAVVPNASVTLTRGNEERTVQADANGVVEVPGLPAGEWTLAARGAGFAVKQRPLIMQGVSQEVVVILDLAPLRQNVLVEAEADPPSPVQLNASASGGSYLDVSVKDLPFNLTVINQEYIRERGVTNLMDALELVSGVTTWTDSGNYIPAADIRGLSTTDAGIYIAENGIVQNSVPQALRNQDSFFLDSVEVLKGPSSFSYGSGTAGASINSKAKMPRNELGFDALFTYESFGRTREGFMVTGPLTKNLSGLFGVVHNQGGTNVQRTHSNGLSWNTALTWTPTERVTVTAQGIYRTDDLATYFSTPILNRRVDPNVDYIELAANTFLDPRTRSLNYQMTDPDNDTRYRRGTVTTDIDVTRGWKLQHRLYALTLRQDTLNVENLNFNQTTLRVQPGGYFFNFKRDWMHGNEVNLRNTFRVGDTRSISFTVGGKIERNNQGRHGQDTRFATNPTPPSMDYLNPIPYEPIHRYSIRNRNVDTDYDSGYFEAAFRFMPKLTLSGGARWDHISNILETFATNTTPNTVSRISFHPVTGRYALAYQLRPTVTLYIGRSHAIQPAGTGTNNTGATALINLTGAQAQFSTQPSRGWEGGVKASAWRERIQATVSYFHMRKYNIITQELINNVTVLERGGKVKSEGIDTMFTVSPTRMFSLQGDFVWDNARYLVFHSVANGVEIDRSGNWLPRVPAVQWSVTPIVRVGPVRASISVRTRGASWSDNNNTQRLAPLTLLSSNVAIRMAKGFTITLTGRNLTDEIVLNRGGLVSGATTARIGLPRNYSMQIERQW